MRKLNKLKNNKLTYKDPKKNLGEYYDYSLAKGRDCHFSPLLRSYDGLSTQSSPQNAE
jgi:hypothetical protein